jgi:hypothetical protein
MAAGKSSIYIKLHAIQRDVTYMAKEGRNTAQGYKFLGEAQITETFKALLEKHGVFFGYSSEIKDIRLSPSGKQTLTGVEVKYRFVDVESGDFIEGVAAGQGTDTGDKGVYKAITGAIKYIFMKTFLIPTGDDPENDTKEERKRHQKDYGTSLGEGDPYAKPPFPDSSESEVD